MTWKKEMKSYGNMPKSEPIQNAMAIAFVFEYFDAFYKDNDSLIEKEYNKLIKKNNNESTI
jgi:hypothetical protein